MFNVSEYTTIIKNKYTQNITLNNSIRIDQIIKRRKEDYHIQYLFDLNFIDIPFLLIQCNDYATNDKTIEWFKDILEDGSRNFSWFSCCYDFGLKNKIDIIAICSNKKENKLYNNLLRLENLKVFL